MKEVRRRNPTSAEVEDYRGDVLISHNDRSALLDDLQRVEEVMADMEALEQATAEKGGAQGMSARIEGRNQFTREEICGKAVRFAESLPKLDPQQAEQQAYALALREGYTLDEAEDIAKEAGTWV